MASTACDRLFSSETRNLAVPSPEDTRITGSIPAYSSSLPIHRSLPKRSSTCSGVPPRVRVRQAFWRSGSMVSRTVSFPVFAESFQWTLFRLSPGR